MERNLHLTNGNRQTPYKKNKTSRWDRSFACKEIVVVTKKSPSCVTSLYTLEGGNIGMPSQKWQAEKKLKQRCFRRYNIECNISVADLNDFSTELIFLRYQFMFCGINLDYLTILDVVCVWKSHSACKNHTLRCCRNHIRS
jgi:hypothetical protein